MVIVGIKLTHDGALALIDKGHLIFCYEIEKIKNQYRHQAFNLSRKDIEDILVVHGYTWNSVDQWVIDGWRGTRLGDSCILENTYIPDLKAENFPLANYGHCVTSNDDLQTPRKISLEKNHFSYESYPHVTGHIFGAYCTSPFAERKEDSFILVWDGEMPPQLFYYRHKEGSLLVLGALFHLAGSIYIDLPRQFKPFCDYYEFDMSIPGKVMAGIALGNPEPSIIQHFQNTYTSLLKLEEHTNPTIFVQQITKSFVKASKIYAELQELDTVDMWAAMHSFLEGLLIDGLNRQVSENTDFKRNLCISGGCALNIKWNSTIRNTGLFMEIWVPPFPNDSGNALGTACAAMAFHTGNVNLDWNVYKGPDFHNKNLEDINCSRKPCSLKELAKIIDVTQEPILFLNDCAELGPRALGNRSILASPRQTEMKDRLNTIKAREPFRPIAPICLENYAPNIFSPGNPDPYMLFEHQVFDSWLDKIPAVVHLDQSARLQTVNKTQHPLLFELLTKHYQLTGIPVLCNTSANLKGRGFFPDIKSAIEWGGVRYIWNAGILYSL
ncbi:Nodulation protein U [hydrothermal vent metagenome]|uniref:Nodulation protein U n=1 Tax=hydrothermal vent metagenome TaxID=652676 RepID=A0A3B0TVX7_9ZZZZ